MKNYFYFILCLFAYGCNAETTVADQIETIELSENIDDILDYPFLDESNISYEIIQLKDDVGKESILPNISKIIEYKDRLYVLTLPDTQNSMSIFNIDGSYITSLRKGRARNEFMIAGDISIDYKNDRLELLDRMASAILSYSLDGEFISKSDMPRKTMTEFCKLSNSQYLIMTRFHSFKTETDCYFKRVEGSEIVQEYFNKPKDLHNLSMGWNLSTSNNNIYCHGTYGNICYKFNEEELDFEPYVRILPVLDIDSKHIKPDMVLDDYFNIFTNFRALCDENLLAFTVRKDIGYSVMYNRNDKEIYQHIFNNTRHMRIIGHNDNEEFFYIYAENIESFEDYGVKSEVAKKIAKELMAKDQTTMNPYIIRVSYNVE